MKIDVDIVTADNELEFREKFCDNVGHSKDCVCETVNTMAKIIANVCCNVDMPLNVMLAQVGVDTFKIHLESILDQKNCTCKH